MRLRGPCFWYLARSLLFALSLSGVSANAWTESQSWEKPVLVIWQDCEAPEGVKDWPAFPTGLIAVVWPDGRIIRAKAKNQVGNSYVEGRVRDMEFEEFLHFVTLPRHLARPDEFSVAVDGASRTVTIRDGARKHQWTRSIPDDQSLFDDIENGMWRLPLQKVHPVGMKNAKLEQFRP